MKRFKFARTTAILLTAASLVVTSAVAAHAKRDKADIQKTIRSHHGDVRACYQQQLKTNPNLAGKVVVSFTIKADGAVSDVTTAVSKSGSTQALNLCVANAAARWSFGPDADGEPTKVTYPFVFKTN